MEIALRRRSAGPLAWIVVAVLCGAVFAYVAGLSRTLGYERRHVTFIPPAASTSSGGGFGLKFMLFFEGQTFHADYEAKIREGALRIGILETFGPIGAKPHFVESVAESGAGRVTFRIPRTGLYSIYFNGSVLGKARRAGGYDVSYSVRWGAD